METSEETKDEQTKETEEPQAKGTSENEPKLDKETEKKGEVSKEEKSNGGVSDYLDESGNAPKKEEKEVDEDESYKKRYSDSSKEAQKIKGELNEVVGLIKNNPTLLKAAQDDLKGNTKKSIGLEAAGSSEDITQLNEKLATLTNIVNKSQTKDREQAIESFEAGKGITDTVRAEMKPTVTQLTKSGFSLEEALEVAWIRRNKGQLTTDAKEEGRLETLAKFKTNEGGTYTTSGKAKKSQDSISLTAKEMEKARKMGITDKEELKGFAKKLGEIRGE